MKQEYSVLEINAEEIMPETIDNLFFTSLYFTVKYEQDTDGQEEKTTEEKAAEATAETTEETGSAAKNETAAVLRKKNQRSQAVTQRSLLFFQEDF